MAAVNKVDMLDQGRHGGGTVAGRRAGGGRASTCARCSPSRRGPARASSRCVEALVGLLPEGPSLLPALRRAPTSRWRCVLAELIREQALRRTREEVPHSIEVQVEEIEERDDLAVCGPSSGPRPSRRRAS